MIRSFVFSDVHANKIALDLIWERILSEAEVDMAWFLGDGLGLGPWPIGTLDTLRDILGEPGEIKKNAWLAGNHDWAIIKRGIGSSYEDTTMDIKVYERLSDYSEDVLDKHRDLLELYDPDFLDAIAKMPIATPASLPNVYLSHGGYTLSEDEDIQVDMIWEYVKNFGYAEKVVYAPIYQTHNLAGTSETVLHCCGHYHKQSLWRRPLINHEEIPVGEELPSGKHWEEVVYQLDEWVELEAGYFYHLNPGSVGFPYPEDSGRPCYALVEGDTGPERVQLKQLPCADYNVAKVREGILEHGYDPRISTGRLMDCYD